MSNEERIAVECVLRAYEEMFVLLQAHNQEIINNRGVYITNDEREPTARGKINGTKEVLRDIMNAKI
jgi:hypothetical protein